MFAAAGSIGAIGGSSLGKAIDGQRLLFLFAIVMIVVGLTMLNAISSSLVAATVFGLTTATSYALPGLIDWTLAAVFVGGGIAGSSVGSAVSRLLAKKTAALNKVFAVLTFFVAIYMLWPSGQAFREVL